MTITIAKHFIPASLALILVFAGISASRVIVDWCKSLTMETAWHKEQGGRYGCE